MIINTAGQVAGAQLVNASSGVGFVGTVTVYVTIDGGTQNIGSVGGGICTAEGNGYYTYRPSQAETNGNLIAFTFIGGGAVPATVQYQTVSAQQQQALVVGNTPGAIVVSTLLNMAAKRANILGAGGALDAPNAADMFQLTNAWIDSLSIERLMIPFILATSFPIVPNKATYSVGIGGDISVARPTYVSRVNYMDGSFTPAIERELDYLTDDAYEAIPIKTLTNTLPSFYYWNPTYASNLGSLSFYQVPTSAVLTGILYAPSPIPQFNTLNDTVILPPGYQFFMMENLAVLFAMTFRENIPVDPNLVTSAKLSKLAIKRLNYRPTEMALDPALVWTSPKSNIYTGTN